MTPLMKFRREILLAMLSSIVSVFSFMMPPASSHSEPRCRDRVQSRIDIKRATLKGFQQCRTVARAEVCRTVADIVCLRREERPKKNGWFSPDKIPLPIFDPRGLVTVGLQAMRT